MPNVDYSKIVMYKIVCKNPEIVECYIGSTSCFNKRKTDHKFSTTNANNKKYNYKIYKFIRDNGGWNNFDMIQIEAYPCNDKTECLTRERELIELEQFCINSNKPIITKLEIIEYRKNYYNIHLNELLDYQKNYREENHNEILNWKNTKYDCDCGSSYSNVNKSRHLKTEKHKNWIDAFKMQ